MALAALLAIPAAGQTPDPDGAIPRMADGRPDPDVYDRPWTISMPLTRAPGYEMYE